ncbi:TonB-dependent receptor [Sphingomonas faeni]|uniref:TonB-dependent receptor n=1 Tax=Sphingomonas faeni TaxID=185950 RepID=UPI0020C78044|nr:TonB-dependent receptor [Sphingomonas faeni]MCP8890748.1 TonB-dependent receptor [Sphingomonas faeni]
MKSITKTVVRSPILTSMLLASTCLPALPAFAQEATKPIPEAADDGAIVITARKRSEDVLKTPVAVNVLSSEAIAAKGIVSVNDVALNTPGINISNVSSGRSDRSFQQISLRGFTPSTITSTLTSMFIDGVPVASATALSTVTDPERIEILRGPQAAYFGRNTFAGAVNVVNKLPHNDLSGSVTGSWGTRDNQDFTAAVEGAIIPDKLTARVTGRYFSKDGSYVNGADRSQTLGDQKTVSGTLFVVAKPTDRLTIKAFGLISGNDDGPSAQGSVSAYEVRANNGAVNIPRLSGSNAGTVIVAGQSNCTLSGLTSGLSSSEASVSRPFMCGAVPSLSSTSPAQNTGSSSLLTNALADGTNRIVSPGKGTDGYGLKGQFQHYHLNIDYALGDTGVILSSLTGYNNEYYSQLADLDNYDSSLLKNTSNATGANANLISYFDFPYLVERQTKDFSQEVRASYDSGPVHAVLGASYLRTKSSSDTVSISNKLMLGLSPDSSSLVAPQKSITKGAFFGLTYALTDHFTISGEGRYQEDEIFAYTGGNAAGLTLAENNSFGLPSGHFEPLSVFYSKTFKNFMPRVIAQYTVDTNLMGYASWSKGVNVSLASFNTNFLNQSGSAAAAEAAASIGLGVVVEPETLSNYEVGIKGKFLDGKVRTSLSAYYSIWSNQMNNRSITFADATTGGINIVSGVANAGKSIMRGIEAEVQILPFRGLSLDLAGAMNDSSIRSFADPSVSKLTGVFGDEFRGNQLPGGSKYSGNVGLQFGAPIKSEPDAAFFVRGDLSYKSRIYSDAANLTWIKSRTQVNFRTGVSKGPASIEAFVTNVFNNKRYTAVANNTLITPGYALASTYSYLTLGLPELRTFGLKVGYKF